MAEKSKSQFLYDIGIEFLRVSFDLAQRVKTSGLIFTNKFDWNGIKSIEHLTSDKKCLLFVKWNIFLFTNSKIVCKNDLRCTNEQNGWSKSSTGLLEQSTLNQVEEDGWTEL